MGCLELCLFFFFKVYFFPRSCLGEGCKKLQSCPFQAHFAPGQWLEDTLQQCVYSEPEHRECGLTCGSSASPRHHGHPQIPGEAQDGQEEEQEVHATSPTAMSRSTGTGGSPGGIDNRVGERSKGLMPNIGYYGNKKTKYVLPSGFRKFLCTTPTAGGAAHTQQILLCVHGSPGLLQEPQSPRERAAQLAIRITDANSRLCSKENE